jgi:hypothetical protein
MDAMVLRMNKQKSISHIFVIFVLIAFTFSILNGNCVFVKLQNQATSVHSSEETASTSKNVNADQQLIEKFTDNGFWQVYKKTDAQTITYFAINSNTGEQTIEYSTYDLLAQWIAIKDTTIEKFTDNGFWQVYKKIVSYSEITETYYGINSQTGETSPELSTYDLLAQWIAARITPITISSLPIFNVTTTNYQCTSGDASLAIQNAIDSLPQNRTEPVDIMLQGVFNSVQNIVLDDNIHFIGQNAILIAVNNTHIFILNPNKTSFTEVHKVFNIDGYDRPFVDWVNLHNVTFQNLNFQHPLKSASGDWAIYCYQSNSTGWGISDNICIQNCEFKGFYSGFYGLLVNSRFENSIFSNYTSNGFMLPYGLNVTIENNTFYTSATDPEILSFPGDYPIIGLHLLDVNVSCIISNNTFITGDYSLGLAVVSSTGCITVTDNNFGGNGCPIAIDFYIRPFRTQGLYVYGNVGQQDFTIP